MRDVQSVNWRGAFNAEEPIVYVVRHGDTEENRNKMFRGFTNSDLDKTGIRQAYEARDELRGVHFAWGYSSDLLRVVHTFDIIMDGHTPVPYERQVAARCWNVGNFTDLPKTQEHKQALQWYADHPETPIPEGESLNGFRARYQPFFRRVIDHAFELGGPILLCQHATTNHEIGNILYGDIDAVNVAPGGIIGIYATVGGLQAKVIKSPERAGHMSYS